MKRIAAKLGVSVSSVSLWTRDIDLTPAQIRRNHFENPEAPYHPDAVAARGRAWRLKNQCQRRVYQEEGRARARVRDPLHMAGCLLYWAEGSKDRNQLYFSNSDPHMASFFCRFLRESLEVEPDQITLRLNVYTSNGLTLKQIEEYWLDALQLPRSCLRSHMLDHKPTSSSGRKKNRLPYGVCGIRVHSTRLVQHIYGAIQEYGEFEEPRWLDGPPRKSKPRGASDGDT